MKIKDRLLCLFYKKTDRHRFMYYFPYEYVKTLPENTRLLALKCLRRFKEIGPGFLSKQHIEIIDNIIGKDLSVNENMVNDIFFVNIWYDGFHFMNNYIEFNIAPERDTIYIDTTGVKARKFNALWNSKPILKFDNIGSAYNYIKYGSSGISDITAKISRFRKTKKRLC